MYSGMHGGCHAYYFVRVLRVVWRGDRSALWAAWSDRVCFCRDSLRLVFGVFFAFFRLRRERVRAHGGPCRLRLCRTFRNKHTLDRMGDRRDDLRVRDRCLCPPVRLQVFVLIVSGEQIRKGAPCRGAPFVFKSRDQKTKEDSLIPLVFVSPIAKRAIARAFSFKQTASSDA